MVYYLYLKYTDPSFLHTQIQNTLHKFLPEKAADSIDITETFLENNTLYIKKIHVRDNQSNTLATIEEIRIDFSSLLAFQISKITIVRPQVFIKKDKENFNFSYFLETPPVNTPDEKGSPILPEIRLLEGSLLYEDEAVFQNEFAFTLQNFKFSFLHLHSQLYSIDLFSETNMSSSPIHISGQYSTSEQSNTLSVEPLALDLSLLKNIRNYPENLEVAGNINLKDLALTPSGISGALELNSPAIFWEKDVFANFPITNLDISANFINSNISKINMSCLIAGENVQCLNGSYQNQEMDLPLAINGLKIDNEFLEKLSFLEDNAKKIISQFTIDSELNSTIEVKHKNSKLDWSANIIVSEGSFIYQNRQPLAVNDFNIEMIVTQEIISIKNGSWKCLQGNFSIIPNSKIHLSELAFEKCEVVFEDIEVTKEVWKSLPDIAQKWWDFLQAEGRADGKMIFPEKIDKKISENLLFPVHYLPRIEVKIKTAKGRVDIAPLLAEEVRGTIIFDKGLLELKNLSGISKSIDCSAKLNAKVWVAILPEPCFDVQVNCKKGMITPEVLEAFSVNQRPESWHAIIREIWHHIEPTKGRLDVNVHVTRTIKNKLQKPDVHVKVKAYDAAITYKDFQYPISEVNGTIVVDMNKNYKRVSIKDFTAKSGNGAFFISGLLTPEDGNMGVSFHVKGNNVSLNNKLKKALSVENQKTWDEFSPQGNINVNVKVEKEILQKQAKWQANIDILNAQMTHSKFSYPVTGIIGDIIITQDNFTLKNIQGNSAHGAKVKASGVIEDKELNIEVDVFQLKLENELYDHIPKGEKVKELFSLNGRVDLNLVIRKKEKLDWRAKIALNRLSGYYQKFPYHFEEISGKLDITENNIEIDSTLKKGNAKVSLVGTFAEHDHNLLITGKNVFVDKELHAAFSPEMQNVFKDFKMQGNVDLEMKIEKTSPSFALAVWPKSLFFVYKGFPYELHNISSSSVVPIKIDSQSVKLHNITSVTPHGKVKIDGNINFLKNGKSIVELKCQATQLLIDKRLYRAIYPYFPDVEETFALTGKIENADVSIFYKEEEKGSYLRYEALINGLDSRTTKENPLQKLSGDFAFKGFLLEDKHTFDGSCQNGTLKLSSIEIDKVEAKIKYFNKYLLFEPIKAKMYDGNVKGSVIVDTSNYGAYKAEFDVNDTNLQKLISSWKNEKSSNITGTLLGSVSFQGTNYNLKQLSGKGWIRISNGYLWELPIFLAIFDLFSLPSKPAFREGEMQFSLLPKTILISSLELHSSLLSISGQGSIKDGICNIRLLTHFAPNIIPSIPIIGQMWNYFKSGFLGLSLTGTFGNPELSYLHWKEIQDLIK